MIQNDIKIIRRVAAQYAEIGLDDSNKEKLALHRAVNDLHPVRPILLIDEIPWNELDYDGSLTPLCQDPLLRGYEQFMRQELYRWKHFRGDRAVCPYLGVQKVIHSTGFGTEVQEETLAAAPENHIVSHRYQNQLETEADLENLQEPIITWDEGETNRRYHLLAEAVGDLIPVKIVGEATGYGLGCKTWDIIATYMGVDELLYALVDKPDFVHRLVDKLTGFFLSTIRQYEQLNLLDGEAYYVHSASASSDQLRPQPEQKFTSAKNVWGRGLAQIFSTVSPQMHDEFDTQYMKRAMEPFGLIYYGCCERLDRKISVIEQIPRLRKISISPWADVDIAAEVMGENYVLSAKPNPSFLAADRLDEDAVRRELQRILDAAERFRCPCEILLKDISTVKNRPENLIRWAEIGAELLGI